jgi:hypothetical protein
VGWLEETWNGLGHETCRGERHCNVRKEILRAESVVESTTLLRAGACEEPFGAVMEVRIRFVGSDTSIFASKVKS